MAMADLSWLSKMERESFIFYRSFYEAIKDLPGEIRLEVYTVIMEYALYGRLPEDLKPFAKGIFTLIKPNIDINNTRYENGKKGGRGSRQKKAEAPAEIYTATYGQEIERLKKDKDWRKTVCADFNISAEEYDKRLTRFLERCLEDMKLKHKQHHDSYEDCKNHLRCWMTKAFPNQQNTTSPASDSPKSETKGCKHNGRSARQDNNQTSEPADYSFNGGFGGQDN